MLQSNIELPIYDMPAILTNDMCNVRTYSVPICDGKTVQFICKWHIKSKKNRIWWVTWTNRMFGATNYCFKMLKQLDFLVSRQYDWILLLSQRLEILDKEFYLYVRMGKHMTASIDVGCNIHWKVCLRAFELKVSSRMAL